MREKVRTEVNEGMEKTQRDFLLRQQLEAIKKQLGEGGDDVAAGYRARLENAGMPENVRAEVERELDRFERTSEQSPEHGWIRTYLDWMFEIPWNVRSEDNLDLAEARRILDEDHTGLEDVKQRIIEFLAVRKLRSERGITVLGGGIRARSSRWSDLPASARRRSASRSPVRSDASSRASRSAASTTRRTSAGIGAPTSAHSRAASCEPSRKRGPRTR